MPDPEKPKTAGYKLKMPGGKYLVKASAWPGVVVFMPLHASTDDARVLAAMITEKLRELGFDAYAD